MSERHVLFQYATCPFCMRVRQFLDQAGIDIDMRDTLRDVRARGELLAGGGRSTVPCLRIERDGDVEWLYESRDIIAYLQNYYAGRGGPAAISNHPRGSNP
jgi:glutathione S-transferase